MIRQVLLTLLIAIVAATPRFAGAAENQRPSTTTAPDRRTAGILNDIDAAAPAAAPPSRTSAAAAPPAAHPYFTRAQSTWEHWRDLSEFFAPGLATAAAIGISASVCGVLVLLRREALLALALPQVVAAGAAVGLRLGWPTLPPALVAAAAALGYLIVTRRRRHSSAGADAALPALYISGLCLSFLIIAGASAHVEDLKNLFTGIDVAVTPARAWTAVPILLAAAATTALTWRRWLLLAELPAAAELAGVHPARWDALFLALLSVVLLLGTASQGVVMVLAMLFLPAATVLPWARRVPHALLSAAIVSLLMVAAAFVISNSLSWPFSQTAGGVGFVILLLSQATALVRA
jgi:ABC-type Mn2+/Zn2+ transport system permease subunit